MNYAPYQTSVIHLKLWLIALVLRQTLSDLMSFRLGYYRCDDPGTLFEALFRRGIVLVATSNIAPRICTAMGYSEPIPTCNCVGGNALPDPKCR